MSPDEQKKQRTAVQRLEADFTRTKDDLTLLLEQGLRAQQHAHQQLVRQHEVIIAKQGKELQALSDNLFRALNLATDKVRDQAKAEALVAAEVSRRGFWGRRKWYWLGA